MKVKYYDLENKRVFITGGGSGIGASIVEHFCEQGSEVYFIDINVSESEKLIENLHGELITDDLPNKIGNVSVFPARTYLKRKKLKKELIKYL